MKAMMKGMMDEMGWSADGSGNATVPADALESMMSKMQGMMEGGGDDAWSSLWGGGDSNESWDSPADAGKGKKGVGKKDDGWGASAKADAADDDWGPDTDSTVWKKGAGGAGGAEEASTQAKGAEEKAD